ncbi:MAG: L-lysine 6-transaminase [Chlorobi bacterium]|nr:L-lysine 6-transaminase [Chlorobiota bacterium]
MPNQQLQSEIQPSRVHEILSRHLLVDGFDLVADLRRSRGARIYDSRGDRTYLDFFTFFASSPIGLNHPALTTPEFIERIGRAAVNKPSNSDVYTVEMAEFVDTFSRIAVPDYLPHAFFVSGGALAVENALKTAFDWKVRKNFAKGHTFERGHQVIHFRQAFHGRSGYTLSLTNTDEVKTKYFPKFSWPRIDNPAIHFPLDEQSIEEVEGREQAALDAVKKAIHDNPDDIAAIIIEPIQGEGGDNHFRKEFFQGLRDIADEEDVLLIFDEVQTGLGLTGRLWAHEWFVEPDIMAFGKKMQVCGILAGRRIDEVEENVFNVSSRINSTWGGNLVDMVRASQYLKVIHEENLVSNAERVGAYLLEKLHALASDFPGIVSNVRGRGLFCAFDLPGGKERDRLRKAIMGRGLLILGCGEKSIRFRPPLNVTTEEIDEGVGIVRDALSEDI